MACALCMGSFGCFVSRWEMVETGENGVPVWLMILMLSIVFMLLLDK